VKAQVVTQSESIKNAATELNKAIKLLNEEALRELKILSENDALTTQNMFAAAKTANKYELADTNLKEAYKVELTKVQGLLTKVNVTKSEIDNAKTSLKAAFNALNGDTKLNKIEKEIDKLNNLTDDQKEQIKNLVTNADTQEKANKVLEKAKELNKAIGDLKAKIEEAKNTKQDPIYSSDTSDKKSAFDNAITESETKLDEHLKVNLSISTEQILEKAKEVKADIKTLDDEIKKLDGKKQALRDEINAYSPNLISEEEKKSYIERIDALDQTNPDSNQANQILGDAFNKAKEKAKEIVNALDNLSDADKKTYTDALTNASKGAASAPDSNLKSIIEQAKAAQKTKQDAIDRIKELSNLTPDQKSELEKQIKEGTTSG
ncbi:hypothetical protein C4M87_03925, partial [Mycoplasmopsis pullorum]|uniref:GA module-containing protein n=1 Tax=Mycoplasmopsis pullorum TaxID=48003 RepID=UPI00111BAFFE